ncbi:DUF481 domain-containing protein [Silvibacterium sp.]|uniref:DUF481 domain-containing protein n=1 Tax=Silvibacterium sp. TaxID=1964179 RepID=UPI0039E5FCE6
MLSNGDTITGIITRVSGGTLTFHSDVLGDLSIDMKKVTAMHSAREFAVGEKGEHLTRATVAAKVPVGKIELANSTVTVTLPEAKTESFPTDQLRFLIDAPTFEKDRKDQYDMLYGWTGSATAGVSIVTATNSAQTYNGAIALVRAIPTLTGLPPLSRISLNLSGTYGLAKDPTIVSGGYVYQTASITKTDILHGDTEYDHYLNRAIFVLGNASADHNFGNGLELQQAYGGGVGWSLLRSPANQLDLKFGLQYEQQQFYNNVVSGLGTPDENLIGATVSENWSRTLPHKIKFTESLALMPTFNFVQGGSAAATAGFTVPVWKQINFTVNSTDNYLGDPPQGFQRNTFQFTTGVTYTLK